MYDVIPLTVRTSTMKCSWVPESRNIFRLQGASRKWYKFVQQGTAKLWSECRCLAIRGVGSEAIQLTVVSRRMNWSSLDEKCLQAIWELAVFLSGVFRFGPA